MSSIALRVEKARLPDAGRDVVRINTAHNTGLGRDDIARLSVNGRSCYVTILRTEEEGVIRMDLDTRLELGVMFEQTYEFEIEEAGKLGQLKWYMNASSPAVRIPAWLAVWSVLLGAAGAVLGLLGLVVAVFA